MHRAVLTASTENLCLDETSAKAAGLLQKHHPLRHDGREMEDEGRQKRKMAASLGYDGPLVLRGWLRPASWVLTEE